MGNIFLYLGKVKRHVFDYTVVYIFTVLIMGVFAFTEDNTLHNGQTGKVISSLSL